MKKSIEDGGGNGAIAVEDRGPLFEGFIGSNNDGTAFVSLADDLEKQKSRKAEKQVGTARLRERELAQIPILGDTPGQKLILTPPVTAFESYCSRPSRPS